MKNAKPNTIAAVRKRRGLSQQELAELVGAHFVTISKLENGKMPLTQEWLAKLADALRVDASELSSDPMPKRRIYVTGMVTGNARIDIFNIPLDDKYYIEVDLHSSDLGFSQWIMVDGDALYPIFKNCDLLRITYSVKLAERESFQGDLCAIQLDEIREGPVVIIGIPTQHYAKDVFDIYMLNGPILRQRKIVNIAKVTMALFDPPTSADLPAYSHYDGDPPTYRNLADWLKKD